MTRAKRPGRPSLGKGDTVAVLVKVAPATRSRWRAAAKREGLGVSEWLRGAAELAIARGSTR